MDDELRADGGFSELTDGEPDTEELSDEEESEEFSAEEPEEEDYI